jgi:hypothetical protein
VFIAEIFKIDLPAKRQPGCHAMHQRPRLGVKASATVETSLRPSDKKHAKGTLVLRRRLQTLLILCNARELRVSGFADDNFC